MSEYTQQFEQSLSWEDVPRAIGNPLQYIVHSVEEYRSFVKANNGVGICFTSHNSYPVVGNYSNPLTVKATKIFFDFDSKNKPENALLDLRTLVTWARKNKLPVATAFSGSKGFHAYLLLKPQKFHMNRYYANYLRSFHNRVASDLKLRTADPKIFGDPRRLCRIWYTRYATMIPGTRKQELGEKYCSPLTEEMVMEMNIDDILEYSLEPENVDSKMITDGREFHTFTELMKKFKIKSMDFIFDQGPGLKPNELIQYVSPDNEHVRNLFPLPCMQMQMSSQNPVHLGRFSGVVHLKKVGFSVRQIYDFFMALGWVDAKKGDMMWYQINHIFHHNPAYRPPTCRSIKQAGFCVGSTCDKYKEDKL